MSEKQRFPRLKARAVAIEIVSRLLGACTQIEVAGSLRRARPEVGDIEIVYISKTENRRSDEDMFKRELVHLAEDVIVGLQITQSLVKRPNKEGRFTYGPSNKLMRHVESGIPVDLFAATEENWWNYLVCRTGPADSNARIATLAQKRGCKWNPYGPGFTNLETNEVIRMESEEAVFKFVGLPYREPKDRI